MTRHDPKRTLIIIQAVLILAIAAPSAMAENIFVDRYDDSATATACLLFTGNDCSLRGAIKRANDNGEDDTIWIPMEGTYTLTRSGSGLDTGDLDITDNLVILGWNQGTVIIDASGIPGGDRVFQIHPGVTASISGVWIQGGNGPFVEESGAGIRNGGTLFLDNVYVSGNDTNIAGGGVFNSATGWLEINSSHVFANHAEYQGGGIYNAGTLKLNDTGVADNISWADGGGIFNTEDGTAILERTTIFSNHVFDPGGSPHGYFAGGGIFNHGDVYATNCTLSDNTAYDNVGGAVVNRGELNLINSTLIYNLAPLGSAIFSVSQAQVNVVNTIISGTCDVHLDWFTSFGGNLESPGSTCPLDHPSDRADISDLMLGPSGYNGGLVRSYPLLPGSPAIDVGNNSLGPAVDQRNKPRPIDGDGDQNAKCDSGSYEYNPAEIFLDGFEDTPIKWSTVVDL